jgi:hypothetical protein
LAEAANDALARDKQPKPIDETVGGTAA